MATIAGAKLTTGLFYDADGQETYYTSGQDDIATHVDAFLRHSPGIAMPPVGQHPAACRPAHP
jgi:hypothetical protein